ncbi:hypothetical protein BX616_008672, partial [Lobosporangium transversale]
GASRKLITLLSKAGMSISHQSILKAMGSLSEDTLKGVQGKVKAESFHVVFDNINMACRKHDQRLDNRDLFESGTAATVIISKETAEEERDTNPARLLCVEDL